MRRSTHCQAPNPAWYAPAPLAPGPMPARSDEPGNARPDDPPGPRPARARAPERAPDPRPRARVEGAAAAVGPQPAPDVLVPRELPGGPRPRVHRPLQPARATSSSTRSPAAAPRRVQAAAEGRIGVGNDLNPLAHVLTAAKLEPATPAEARTPARGPAARVGRGGRPLARPRRPRAGAARPSVGVRPGGRQRRRPRRAHRARPRRGQRRVPRAHARPAPARPLAASASTTARTGSSPARSRASSTARRRRTCRRSCPTRSAWRRATSCDFVAAHRLRAAGARRVRRPVGEARPPVPPAAARRPTGISLLGDARTAGRRSRAALRAPRPAGPGPPDRHVAALPAGAQVRLLQLAADVAARVRRPRDRRDPRRRPPRASPTSRSCATSSPTSGPRSPTTGSPW